MMNNMVIIMSFVLTSLILMNTVTDMVNMPNEEIDSQSISNPPTPNDINQSEINSIVPNSINNYIVTENSEKNIANAAPVVSIETNETRNIQPETPSNDSPVVEPDNETISNDTNNGTESSEEELIPLADIRSSNDFD
jgi:hypothetical protein